MGYYADKKPKKRYGLAWMKWLGVVVVSAGVGAGTTGVVLSTSVAKAATSPVSTSSSGPITTTNVQVTDSVVQVVQRVKPAVMGVVNYSKQTNAFSNQTQLEPTGVGSGVLFYKDAKYGYLVTNHHVVANAAKVQVVNSKGDHFDADVVGSDPFTDLAVVRVPLKDVRGISVVPFANSDDISAGDSVVAIGTPEGLSFKDSVTKGIISAKSRMMPVATESHQVLDYQSVIQTDAAINPGNSGGPLLNMKGEIVGINSSKIEAQGVSGMGFAIPSNEVKYIANQLLKHGQVVHPELGIAGYALTTVPQELWPSNIPVNYGVWVQQVESNGAKQAGIEKYDVITAIDGHKITDAADLRTYIFEKQPGDTVKLTVYRGQKKLTLHAKLGKYKPAPASSNNNSAAGNGNGPYDSLNPFSPPGLFGN